MIALKELKKVLNLSGIPSYRASQVFNAVYKKGESQYENMHVLPEYVRDFLKENVPVFSFKVTDEKTSRDGSATKTLVEFKDQSAVEAVLLRFEDGRNTVCVSSQVGCALNCAFCATGKMNFKRNLTSEEITDQVLYFQHKLFKSDERVDHIVFMGMGEPFNNYDSVSEAVGILNDPVTFNIGKRNITVSTAGIIEGIRKIAIDHPQVNLAVSLHAPTQQLREKLMPIAKKYFIGDLIDACGDYIKKTHRRVTYEYIALKNINDTEQHAHQLANLIRGQLCHVNLIKYNKIGRSKFSPSTPERIKAFEEILKINQIPSTVRVSLGRDIDGACGQLAGKNKTG